MAKAFSFFSGKGGVGKTTLTILFASFLAYAKHLRVKVFDLDNPDFRVLPFRKMDLRLLSTEGTPLYNFANRNVMPEPFEYFDIEETGPSIGDYSSKAIKTLTAHIGDEKRARQYDVLLLDFPADYDDGIPVDAVAKAGLLDVVYVPMAVEQQERRSACKTALGLTACGINVRLLWNRVDRDILAKGDRIDLAEAQIQDRYGLLYSPIRVHSFRRATQGTSDKCFVRTTVCWPERYIRMWCPELENLFNEISTLLGV